MSRYTKYGNYNKYGNIRTTTGGIEFASKAEAQRYTSLKLREDAGIITGLRMQQPFVITVLSYLDKRVQVGKYVSDFSYFDKDGNFIVEDVKSPALAEENQIFAFKKRCVEAIYGFKIRVIAPDEVMYP